MQEARVELPQMILPLTVEQQTLQVLERIEKLLSNHWEKDTPPLLNADGTQTDLNDLVQVITPTKTPFLEQQNKKNAKSGHKSL